MKTTAKTLIVIFLAGSIGSSCATITRLNEEYAARVAAEEKLTKEQKAELERQKHESQLPGNLPRHP